MKKIPTGPVFYVTQARYDSLTDSDKEKAVYRVESETRLKLPDCPARGEVVETEFVLNSK